MKVILFTFLMGLIGINCLSQSAEVKWGSATASEHFFSGMLDADADGNVYALTKKRKNFSIEKYAADNYDLVSSSEIAIPEGETPESIIKSGNQCYIITSVILTGSFKINAYPLDMKGQLGSASQILFIDGAKKLGVNNIVVKQNADKTRTAVGLIASDYKNDQKKIFVGCFDSEAKVLYTAEDSLAIHHTQDDVTYLSLDVAPDGGCVFLRRNDYWYKNESKYVIDVREYTAVFFNSAGGEEKEIPIQLAGAEKIRDAMITFEGNEIKAGGFYDGVKPAKKAKVYSFFAVSTERIAGAFFMHIDPVNGRITSQNQKAFDTELLTNYLKEEEIEPANKTLPGDFKVQSFIKRSSGGFYIISQYKLDFSRTYDAGDVELFYKVFGDVLVTQVDADGKITWTKGVPMKQISAYKKELIAELIVGHSTSWGGFIGNDYPFYFTFPHDAENLCSYLLSYSAETDRLNFIFNEEPANKDVVYSRELNFFTMASGNLKDPYGSNFRPTIHPHTALITISGDGTVARSELTSDKEIYPRPLQSISLGNDSFAVYGSWRNEYRLGTLVFK